MKLTSDASKLKEMMVVLDGHSKQVMDRHYILRDPEDDVVLAKALVKEVLGETVAWPTDEEADVFANDTSESLSSALHKAFAGDFSGVSEIVDACGKSLDVINFSDDEDDSALVWWENAEKFGVPNPQLYQIIPLPDCSPFGEAPALMDESMSVQIPVKTRKNSISSDKLKLYDQYTMPKGSLSRRMKVSPEAHAYMVERVKEWQQENCMGQTDRPVLNEWYLDVRVDAIQAGFLTKHHSPDVVKSYLKSWVFLSKKVQAANDLEVADPCSK